MSNLKKTTELMVRKIGFTTALGIAMTTAGLSILGITNIQTAFELSLLESSKLKKVDEFKSNKGDVSDSLSAKLDSINEVNKHNYQRLNRPY